jgi:hypothetical protein
VPAKTVLVKPAPDAAFKPATPPPVTHTRNHGLSAQRYVEISSLLRLSY